MLYLSLSLCLSRLFPLSLTISLSVLLLNPLILSISLSSLQTLTLTLCLPANPPLHPPALLPFPPLTLSHYLSLIPFLHLFFPLFLNHSPCNVNSNCLVWEDSTAPIMPKALRRTQSISLYLSLSLSLSLWVSPPPSFSLCFLTLFYIPSICGTGLKLSASFNSLYRDTVLIDPLFEYFITDL